MSFLPKCNLGGDTQIRAVFDWLEGTANIA